MVSFQFTCPSRSTTFLLLQPLFFCFVSIHVPLAEHDRIDHRSYAEQGSFNSRAPRGARPLLRANPRTAAAFQFTCPSRSTTTAGSRRCCTGGFQFTCPSRSTTSVRVIRGKLLPVSIHVPLAEHDAPPAGAGFGIVKFQFTCPSRSTTPSHTSLAELYAFQFTCPSRSTTSLAALGS